MNLKKSTIILSMFVATIIPQGVATGTPIHTQVNDSQTNGVVTCTPRPACLDAKPPCAIAEPIAGWCSQINPHPTCTPRPACLDANPPCKLIIINMCPQDTPTPTPAPIHCGGNIKNAPMCPAGYRCKLNKIADLGGTCEPITPSASPTSAYVNSAEIHASFFARAWNFFIHLLRK